MEINYYVLGSMVLLLVVLIVFFMKWNNRDRKDMEKTINMSEMEPEEHPKDKI